MRLFFLLSVAHLVGCSHSGLGHQDVAASQKGTAARSGAATVSLGAFESWDTNVYVPTDSSTLTVTLAGAGEASLYVLQTGGWDVAASDQFDCAAGATDSAGGPRVCTLDAVPGLYSIAVEATEAVELQLEWSGAESTMPLDTSFLAPSEAGFTRAGDVLDFVALVPRGSHRVTIVAETIAAEHRGRIALEAEAVGGGDCASVSDDGRLTSCELQLDPTSEVFSLTGSLHTLTANPAVSLRGLVVLNDHGLMDAVDIGDPLDPPASTSDTGAFPMDSDFQLLVARHHESLAQSDVDSFEVVLPVSTPRLRMSTGHTGGASLRLIGPNGESCLWTPDAHHLPECDIVDAPAGTYLATVDAWSDIEAIDVEVAYEVAR